MGLFDAAAFAPVLKLLQVGQCMRRKTFAWQTYILVSLAGFKRFCTCSRVCSNLREVEDGLPASLFKFSKSWTGTRSARFDDDGPAPRSGIGMMSANCQLMKSYSPHKVIVDLPDSKGMTDVNGENGRASCRVKGRENLAGCPDGCANGMDPLCAPLVFSGPSYAILRIIRAQRGQP